MAVNLTNKQNNNPLWVVLLLFVIWLIVFIYRLKNAL
jgi:hypothetical protein